ncbi:hypothetical protein BMS3Bbin07_00586 [bacterium BMS3Bbin07]|nr:hypothetical protein BMS3Bbin07_00586 [bacterium BMS3Bbin07]
MSIAIVEQGIGIIIGKDGKMPVLAIWNLKDLFDSVASGNAYRAFYGTHPGSGYIKFHVSYCGRNYLGRSCISFSYPLTKSDHHGCTV